MKKTIFDYLFVCQCLIKCWSSVGSLLIICWSFVEPTLANNHSLFCQQITKINKYKQRQIIVAELNQ